VGRPGDGVLESLGASSSWGADAVVEEYVRPVGRVGASVFGGVSLAAGAGLPVGCAESDRGARVPRECGSVDAGSGRARARPVALNAVAAAVGAPPVAEPEPSPVAASSVVGVPVAPGVAHSLPSPPAAADVLSLPAADGVLR